MGGARTYRVPHQSAPFRVLCVDDDVHVLTVLTDTLSAHGYQVETAVDGSHGLQKLATAEWPYHLIIADARMPHLDGWRFIMQARANGFAGGVIIFSGWLDDAERTRYRELRIDALVDKPPEPGALLAAVKSIAARGH